MEEHRRFFVKSTKHGSMGLVITTWWRPQRNNFWGWVKGLCFGAGLHEGHIEGFSAYRFSKNVAILCEQQGFPFFCRSYHRDAIGLAKKMIACGPVFIEAWRIGYKNDQ